MTALRAEVKFAVPAADLDKLRTILQANFRRLVYNRPVSNVNSIYFDDILMSAACENLEGSDRRTKVRLRWYDRPEPGTKAFLEVKRRMSRMIGKDRYAVESRDPIASMTYDTLRSELISVVPPRIAELLMLRPEPVLINRYSREHFAVPGSTIRITLDYAIECSAQIGLVRPTHRFPVALQDLVVIEGKAPRGSETELRRLLHPLALRVTRCSKYVRGCQALGLASTSAGLTED